jgi:YggT family protein
MRMGQENIWWPYLYFHLPNYAFAVLFWTLIGRFMFSLFLPPDSPNYIYRWFRRLTDWLMRPVGFITPAALPPLVIAPIAAFWVALVRIAFFMIMYMAGRIPAVTQ